MNEYGDRPKCYHASTAWKKLEQFEVTSKHPWASHSKGTWVIMHMEMPSPQPPPYGLLRHLRPIPLTRAVQLASGDLRVLGPSLAAV